MADLFISYARADDEPFVQKLYQDLTARGFAVWWDRRAMESRGRTFLQEIRDAIASVERLILVVGPQAVRSDYVRAEWQFALETCRVVIPILRLGDPSLAPAEAVRSAYTLLPAGISQFHCPNFLSNENYADALEELIRILASPLPPLAELATVIELAPNYLPRPALMKQLEQAVLADVHSPVVVDHRARVTALVGMGGVGKSVLGSAFARQCGTRRALGDGIHWLKFGREADLLANFRRCAQLVGARSDIISDPETGKAQIASQLAGQSCLIVLDDVTELSQAVPFRDALGPRCRLLITTRDRKLAIDLGAKALPVDALDDQAALELLALCSGQPVNHLPVEATAIVDECGNLPLAISMIGATLRANPKRWKHVLEKLRRADLEHIEGALPNYDHPNLLKAIEVSVDALKPQTRACYFELGVFPEDAAVPESVISRLWKDAGVDESVAADLIDELVNRSLAFRDATSRITLHDLQLDYVRAKVSDQYALHRRLLDGYSKQCRGEWAGGPNDGYFFEQLSHHLKATGRTNELLALLTDSPAWMVAKQRALSSHQSLMTDMDRALEGLADLLAHAKLAAVRALVQLHTESHSDHVLQALVWLGRLDEAVSHARLADSDVSRLNALWPVYDAAQKKGADVHALGSELLRAAERITAEHEKTDAFRDVGVLLAKAGDSRSALAFQQAREAANRIPFPWVRARKLCDLAVAMVEPYGLKRSELLDEAWNLVELRLADAEIDDVQMEAALAFARAGQFDRAEAVAEGTTHEGWRENARAYLAKAYAEAGQIEVARERAKRSSFTREVVLPSLAFALIRAGQFAEARQIAQRISALYDRARVLAVLGKALAGAGQRGSKAAFTVAWKILQRCREKLNTRVARLCNLAMDMAEGKDARSVKVISQAIKALGKENGAGVSAQGSAAYDVAMTLTRSSRLDDAWQLAKEIQDDGWRGAALGLVAEAMARTGHRRAGEVLEQAIAASATSRDDHSWGSTLRALAWLLGQYHCFASAWRVARMIPDDWMRLKALTALAQEMASVKPEQARQVLDEAIKLVPWNGFAPDVAERLREISVAMAMAGDRRTNTMITKAAQVAQKSERSGQAHGLLAQLAGALSGAGHRRADGIAEEAERLAAQVRDPEVRADRLAELAVELHASKHPRAKTVLERAKRVVWSRGKVLVEDGLYGVARAYASFDQFDEARRILRRAAPGWSKGDVERSLVARLAAAQQWESAWQLCQEIQEESARVEALVGLATAAARSRLDWTDRVIDAAIASIDTMPPSPFRTRLQSQLVLPLVLRDDERADAFLAAARAGDPENANWSGIKAVAVAEVGKLGEALGLYQPSGTEAFVHTLMCWAGTFDAASPGLALRVLGEATRVLGWVRPDWQLVHTEILAALDEWASLKEQPSFRDPIPVRNADTAIFAK